MYEDLIFGAVKNAQRVSQNDADDIRSLDVSVKREASADANRLVIDGVGPETHELHVDLVPGDVEMRTDAPNITRKTMPDLTSSVEVDDGTMTVTIDEFGAVWTVEIECEGEVNDNTGPNLERFGVDI